jgi:hypothetical protein
MEARPIDGLTLFFDAEHREAAELIGRACEQAVRLIQARLGLSAPEDCRVYVMTSWPQFLFHAAPWHWRILLGLTVPSWHAKVKRLWTLAGGWQQQYGRRRAVGVKPPHIWRLADTSIGERIFVQEDSVEEKVRRTTCHELTHAFTAHLRLPMWLNEGLAMMTVDEFAGKPTVQPQTLATLTRSSEDTGPGRYRKVQQMSADALVYHTIRGYWLTRYIEDTQPNLLRGLLQQRQCHAKLENKVATAYGMGPAEFWRGINGVIVSHFEETTR